MRCQDFRSNSQVCISFSAQAVHPKISSTKESEPSNGTDCINSDKGFFRDYVRKKSHLDSILGEK